jgi:hypothetical protein
MTLKENVQEVIDSLTNEIADYTHPVYREQKAIAEARLHDYRWFLSAIEQEQSKWISVEDRVPEPNKRVLVCDKFNIISMINWHPNFNYSPPPFLFWKPLPQPPKQ